MKPDAAPSNVNPPDGGAEPLQASAPRVTGAVSEPGGASQGEGGSVVAFARTPVAAAAGPLVMRLEHAAEAEGLGRPRVVPAECVGLFSVDLPVRGAARRRAALPFALEEELAAPLDRLHVALGPADPPPTSTRVLAAAIERETMVAAQRSGGTGPVLPEMLAIPRPAAAETGGPAWAVWRSGARCVVRVSDGTGFALRTDMLEPFWERAGRPAITSLGEALPGAVPARDASSTPPPPDEADLGFDLAQGAFAEGVSDWGATARIAAWAGAAGLSAALLLLALDVSALGRLAQDERQRAQRAVEAVLPGIAVGPQTGPVLARLQPAPQAPARGTFLPLLSRTADALLDETPPPSFRRLAFSGPEERLTVLVEAGGLEALQALEQALGAAGLDVASGAATASDGAAQAEFRITHGGGS
ncbi:type II secretion system protein GspL [Profundibacterium mesophilum]|uniref:Type II secretion system protein L n=1 Tax=Profundibacterium mesophilum KAUST100406-0324 TaxID=1037889 RepID=A0A921NV51_9RHOB|nr:type II secretion system protein GspL [Profundibacterium mesophilum]KAF0675836.1 Type II secretion system protein L [Profundibacterium mesophilum KAUST100406-0324]